ncbi:unnamed protein product [Durusdinium trenchii]|uniref:Uncharacterized protein n=1 Tax=Durusdinium trenchii TaxID=1381693 RepID=A0ABP0SAU6_9DINO
MGERLVHKPGDCQCTCCKAFARVFGILFGPGSTPPFRESAGALLDTTYLHLLELSHRLRQGGGDNAPGEAGDTGGAAAPEVGAGAPGGGGGSSVNPDPPTVAEPEGPTATGSGSVPEEEAEVGKTSGDKKKDRDRRRRRRRQEKSPIPVKQEADAEDTTEPLVEARAEETTPERRETDHRDPLPRGRREASAQKEDKGERQQKATARKKYPGPSAAPETGVKAQFSGARIQKKQEEEIDEEADDEDPAESGVEETKKRTGDGGGRPLGEEWKKADALAMETIAGWKTVQAKGSYWEEAAEVAGNLVEVRLSGGQREVVIRVTGTNCEAVLKAMSADAKREMVLHLCPDPCPVKAWSDNLMHISEIKEVELDSLAWGRCLLDHREGTAGEEDELSRLRREADEMRDRGKGRGDTAVGGEVMAPPGDPGGAKTDKDEEKKRRKKKKRKKVKIEGTKELSVIYGKTGRRRIRKRARKITDRGKSKKRSSSSDSEESSSSTSGASLEGDQELFEAPTPVQQVWKKYPGSLTSAMVAEARQSLLVQLGGHSLRELWRAGRHASEESKVFNKDLALFLKIIF